MSWTSLQSAAVPRLRRVPDCHHNDAGLVVELAAAYGTNLDPHQIDALEAACGIREDGLWAAPTFGWNQPRQTGKTAAQVVRALAGPLVFGEKVVVLSAHQQKTSRLLFQSVESYFANYPDLTKRVKAVTAALGREEIRLKNGAVIVFPARTRSSLRGWSVDCYLADEAQLLGNDQWASARPSMAARRGSQVWMCGTAPNGVGDAEVFGRLRQTAIAGTDTALAWVEYGAEPGCDLDDREQWAAANPGRVELEAIINERRELSDRDFAIERLNIWPTEVTEAVFGPGMWAALSGPRRDRLMEATAIGLDRSHDGLVCAVAAYRDFDKGTTHLEVAYLRDQADSMAATVDWILANSHRRTPIVLDAQSTAGPAIALLQNARRPVVTTSAQEAVRAAIGLADDVVSGMVTHADANGVLAQAVDGARKRPIGDAGGWGWDRRDSSVVISPLVAATLANYGAVAHGRRRNRVRGGDGRRAFIMN